MTVELLVIVAILVEAIVETLKLIYDKANRSVDTAVILALVVAIGVSVICRLGLFGLVGVTMPWVADAICTGVIISRGMQLFAHPPGQAQGYLYCGRQ